MLIRHISKRWLPILVVAILIAVWYAMLSRRPAAAAALSAPVKQGYFKILVTTTGEIRANKSISIDGPTAGRSLNVPGTTISWLIPEGSVVKAGDVVAEIDRTSLSGLISDKQLDTMKTQAEYTNAMLDSALAMQQASEEIRTDSLDVEEKKLDMDQAQFEAPSVKRQAEIAYERAIHALEQVKKVSEEKAKQASAKSASARANLEHERELVKKLTDILNAYTVKAPAAGMVVYLRDEMGEIRGVGARWGPYDPTVATLPDQSEMESDTYVNEIDVHNVHPGEPAEITLDADPNNRLRGTVTEVSNIGMQRPGTDAKVFSVKIRVVGTDTSIHPGLTTENTIETASIPNVLFIPLDAVVDEDGFSYVYKQAGGGVIKQMILTSAANNDEIIVKQGLKKGDRVMLAVPEDTVGITTVVIPGLKPRVAPSAPAARAAEGRGNGTKP